uniref:AlNc14C535G12086 protein n=1 Tax=Albugo laibachii Nc14 TaxID=890382 RepID=F0X0Z9_9STRA|nr:AlNc14C535G12086 [Albugo laibachii Nc14]|eukprot:CCA27445.1 AlNc14C535G12086 [Albugo laibachii Nc14]
MECVPIAAKKSSTNFDSDAVTKGLSTRLKCTRVLWIRRAHIPETPAPVVTKHPAPQASLVTKQLSLGGTQGRQAHSIHINFFNILLNLPPSARIHHTVPRRHAPIPCKHQNNFYGTVFQKHGKCESITDPNSCSFPQATSLALNHSIFPTASVLVSKTHFVGSIWLSVEAPPPSTRHSLPMPGMLF